jgi:phosphatidylglycerol lysyltransferase
MAGKAMARLRAAVRNAPVTATSVVVLWVVGAVSDSLVAGPPHALRAVIGAGVDPVHVGRWWTVLTSVPWCAQVLGYLATSVATLALLPFAERRLGWARTVAAMAALQVAGVLGGIALVGLAHGGARWVRQLDHTVMLGPSAAVVGVVLLASAGFGPIWRRRARLLLVSGLAMMALYSGMLGDVLRLGTGLLGLLVGMATLGRHRRRRPEQRRPSARSETRVLVALLVAVSAIGPLVAALADTRIGPLAVLRYVFTSPVPDAAMVRHICGDPVGVCAAAQTRARLGGWGSAVMSVMPVVVLLVSAVGLWRGRRVAWVAALALHIALGIAGLVLAANASSRATEQLLLLGSGVHVHAWLVLALPALQPLGVAVVLVVTRRRFGLPAPPQVLAEAARTVAVVFGVVTAVFVVGGVALRQGFTPAPDLAALVIDLPTRLLPPVYLGWISPTFLPTSPPTWWLFEWTGPVFWAGSCVAALRTFLVDRPAVGDRELLRELTCRGGSTLAWIATWKDNASWFTPDGTAGLAYRVVSGVALTVGGPVGETAAAVEVVQGFVAHCREQGWTPALYGVVEEVAAVVRAAGWSSVQVAEETLLPLAGLSFTGRRWQDVRTAMNRARRAGITARWTAYPAAPSAVREQVRSLSAQWAAAKGLPEMGFTLGGLDEVDDPQVRLLLAVDTHERVLAVTSWLPVRADGTIVGWTLDFMRRRPDAPAGIMEFLIATAALDVRADGAELLSLSGAPLARNATGGDGLQRLLDTLARRLEPVYGFGSLLTFKAKFQPIYRPLYLAYPDAVALPAIGNALARAYLPELGPRTITRLARAVWIQPAPSA